MNRVAKRFLKKLAEPVGIVLYVMATMIVATYVEVSLEYGVYAYIAVLSVMIIIPLIFMMLRMTWQQAKFEIEHENKEVLDTLKGK